MDKETTKLIKHNAGDINRPDDPSCPWKLHVNLSPPDFMRVAFCSMYGGSEEIVVRGMTREALQAFADEHGLSADHPRFRRMEITGPGVAESHVRGKEPLVTRTAPVEAQDDPTGYRGSPVATCIPTETPIPRAVTVAPAHHPYTDDCDLVVVAPVTMKDMAGTVAEALQRAAPGESGVRSYVVGERVIFMVTHA